MNDRCSMRRTALLASIPLLLSACAPFARNRTPSFMHGSFVDDYNSRHTIGAQAWQQHPSNRFRIVRWYPAGQYLIAQNDSTNRGAPGKWTRIDWMKLVDMAPYTWAFCFTAYDAASAAAAEAVTIADRSTPRTGCNGYPFTRMRPDTTR